LLITKKNDMFNEILGIFISLII